MTIKPNDLVYIPSESNDLYEVYLEKGNMKVCVCEDECYTIHKQGQRYYFELGCWGTQRFAFLATPENKEKLEKVYGELKDIPVDEEVEKFSEALNKLSAFYANLESPSGSFAPSDKLQELNEIKSGLIDMFIERGKND